MENSRYSRLLRSPVVGRKTECGTHSKREATTTAILFSLVESCKLNKVNPREFFKKLVQDIHDGNKPYTPREFKMLSLNRGNKGGLPFVLVILLEVTPSVSDTFSFFIPLQKVLLQK